MEHNARLTLHSTGGTVEIDGHDVSGAVRSIGLVQTAGRPPELMLGTNVHEVVIDGRTVVRLAPADEELLVVLGWTPPGATALTADTIREPASRDAALAVLRLAARIDPAWMRELINHEARVQGHKKL